MDAQSGAALGPVQMNISSSVVTWSTFGRFPRDRNAKAVRV
jgi:hypothetical protein